jgi:hypothetical protein
MKIKALWIIFLAFLLIFLTVKIPFSIINPTNAASALSGKFSGTIWNGTAKDIITPVGALNLRFKASPLSLLMLSVSGEWQANSLGVNAQGKAETSLFSNRKLTASQIELNLSAFNIQEAIIGTLNLDIRALEISENGACIAVDGDGKTDALIRSQETLNWRGPLLEGPLSCDNGNFILTLAGENNGERVTIKSTLFTNGLYQHDITVSSDNPLLAAALVYQGFEDNIEDFRLQKNGQWR